MHILYWVRGPATLTQKRAAKKMGAVIRDRLAWHPGDSKEIADAVAGEVPPQYDGLPRVSIPGNEPPPYVSPPDPASPRRTYVRRKKQEIKEDAKSLASTAAELLEKSVSKRTSGSRRTRRGGKNTAHSSANPDGPSSSPAQKDTD